MNIEISARFSAFPSLTVEATNLRPQGAFAKAQAIFLRPEPLSVKRLETQLAATQTGIVAHFYMDPELQGVLAACSYPHVHISDSLAMADRAVQMARAGVRSIIVLGVDFMAENVRAMLDTIGMHHVEVYTVAEKEIGCSLAQSAESQQYQAFLRKAAATHNSLHVVYINTSLRTKAFAHQWIPTLTCTSSNVVQTILQAFSQSPDLKVWFGPDTYMGQNLESMFRYMAKLDESAIAAIHPSHTPQTIEKIFSNFHYFRQGNCIVHHMFGGEVVDRVRSDYADAHIAAHLEVPGEMFALALEAQQCGRGVVGSTSDILRYVSSLVENPGSKSADKPTRVILGTEVGMVTSIVHQLQLRLAKEREITGASPSIEIVFPVAYQAISVGDDQAMPIIPGPAAGEGCSPAGGCATCPYMKMNSLETLMDLVESLDRRGVDLSGYRCKKYSDEIDGESIAALGSVPIVSMRKFQQSGQIPESLLAEAWDRTGPAAVESLISSMNRGIPSVFG